MGLSKWDFIWIQYFTSLGLDANFIFILFNLIYFIYFEKQEFWSLFSIEWENWGVWGANTGKIWLLPLCLCVSVVRESSGSGFVELWVTIKEELDNGEITESRMLDLGVEIGCPCPALCSCDELHVLVPNPEPQICRLPSKTCLIAALSN